MKYTILTLALALSGCATGAWKDGIGSTSPISVKSTETETPRVKVIDISERDTQITPTKPKTHQLLGLLFGSIMVGGIGSALIAWREHSNKTPNTK